MTYATEGNHSDQLGKGPEITFSTAGSEEENQEFSFSSFLHSHHQLSNSKTCPSFPLLLSLLPFLAVYACLNPESPKYH